MFSVLIRLYIIQAQMQLYVEMGVLRKHNDIRFQNHRVKTYVKTIILCIIHPRRVIRAHHPSPTSSPPTEGRLCTSVYIFIPFAVQRCTVQLVFLLSPSLYFFFLIKPASSSSSSSSQSSCRGQATDGGARELNGRTKLIFGLFFVFSFYCFSLYNHCGLCIMYMYIL